MAKADQLFVTESQIAERIGLPTDKCKTILKTLEKDGFPMPDQMFENRRYWPACKAFLDRRYDLGRHQIQGNHALDGEEKWN
ncbi:winged helix-turn-helix domain-containing protein [Brucella sp. C7-11G]